MGKRDELIAKYADDLRNKCGMEPDMDLLYDAITVNPAAAIGLDNHRFAIGNEANLVVIEGENLAEALRFHAAPRAVISHGRLVDRDAMRVLAAVPE
mgnify:CR=1 FL=1